MLYTDITELIGDTPLLLLDERVHGLQNVDLYAKLELFNPFGSVKDRVAWGLLRDDLADIAERGLTLIEASSGNTAKALQILAGMRGLTLEVLTNRVKVQEVRDVLDVLGSKVQELPGLSECPDPTVPNDVFSTIESVMAASPGAYFHASQYTNEKNIQTHYANTGAEIFADLGPVDFLFGGLGTTGSTRGAGTYLREKNANLKTVGVVSTKYDFIPGIRSANELWDVGLFEQGFYEKIAAVESADAVDGAVQLARRYGVLAGPTSGAAYSAALGYFRERPCEQRQKAVVIVCDRLEWYLSYLRKRSPELFGQTSRASIRDLPAGQASSAPEVTPEELEKLLTAGNLLLVDTRGSMAYRIGHIPGSLNIRDDRLDDMLGDGVPFPRGMRVVFVCPIGEYSRRAAAFLGKQGYQAASLAGGVVGWRDAGKRLEPGR